MVTLEDLRQNRANCERLLTRLLAKIQAEAQNEGLKVSGNLDSVRSSASKLDQAWDKFCKSHETYSKNYEAVLRQREQPEDVIQENIVREDKYFS